MPIRIVPKNQVAGAKAAAPVPAAKNPNKAAIPKKKKAMDKNIQGLYPNLRNDMGY